MGHEVEQDAGDPCQVFFTGFGGDVEEVEDDGLSDLSNGLRRLRIEEPVAHRHIDIKVSSASVQRLTGLRDP